MLIRVPRERPLLLGAWTPFLLAAVAAACLGGCRLSANTAEGPESPRASKIASTLFRHHYVSRDLPGERTRYGLVPPADFDGDGDVDYGVFTRDTVYWFENRSIDNWIRHTAGTNPTPTLGGAVMDVDQDGHTDILLAGLWYRNTGDPTNELFERHVFDSTIGGEMHDMVGADVDGDGRTDLVSMGDGEGAFWYAVPDDPSRSADWPRITITMSVLNENDDIHSGFFPNGVDDLDGDGDADLILADRWLENREGGKAWIRHHIPAGARGPWGLSSRSWITDLDGDGLADIVLLESDGTGSGGVWLENRGGAPPSFAAHELPTSAAGTRGSFHSLFVGDFDDDGDADIFTAEQEDPNILPMEAPPRWFIWENDGGSPPAFTERIIFDGRLGGHDALAADVDGDGDLDILSKIWSVWSENGNGGVEHVDVLENLLK